MSFELGQRLVSAGVLSTGDLGRALHTAMLRRVPLVRALVELGLIAEHELTRRAGDLVVYTVVPAADLVARLPEGLMERLGVIPVRVDPFTGAVDAAALDPKDSQGAQELSFHLGVPVRLLATTLGSFDEALTRLAAPKVAPPPPSRPARKRRMTPPFPHGAPRSSVPPPPSDLVPIPLVRRSGGEPARSTTSPPERKSRSSRKTLRFGSAGPARVEPDREAILPHDEAENQAAPAVLPAPDRSTLRLGAAVLEAGQAAAQRFRSIEDAARNAEPAVRERRTPPQGTPRVGAEAATPARHRSRRPIMTTRPPAAAAEPPVAEAPSLADPEVLLDAVHDADSRDELMAALVTALAAVARRIAIFAVKKEGYRGFVCTPSFADPDSLMRVVVPGGIPSIFATAAATSVYLGPIPSTPAHLELLAVMGRASGDVAVAAVRPKGRVALFVVVDDLADTMRGTKFLRAVADAAADALVHILTARA